MNKYLLSAILACLFPLSMLAQSDAGTVSIITKAGMSISNLSPKDQIFYGNTSTLSQSVQSGFRSGFNAGLEMEYQFSDLFSASLGTFFTNSGCKYKDAEYKEQTNTFNIMHESYLSMGYLQVPIMLNTYVIHNLAIKVGFQMGYLLTSTVHRELQSYTIDPNTKEKIYGTNTVIEGNASDLLNHVDFSIPVGLSYEYEHMVFDAQYHFGLCNVYKELDQTKQRYFTLSIGYKFEL